MRIVRFIVAIVLLISAAAAQDVTVAAAADLQPAFKELVPKFEAATGLKVSLSFGSSGNIATQIHNGAPYDIFFSADVQYPLNLQKAGLIDDNSLYEYAVGRIVLWVPNGSKIDVRKGLNSLLDPSLHKLAIGNPQHAPYGRAAVAALKSTGLYERLQSKFVLGENISQAAQFVQTGNADAGVIALSLALAPAMNGKGAYVEIDPKSYPEMRQAAVILKSSKHKPAAQKFIDFLKSQSSQDVLRRYGFTAPSSK